VKNRLGVQVSRSTRNSSHFRKGQEHLGWWQQNQSETAWPGGGVHVCPGILQAGCV